MRLLTTSMVEWDGVSRRRKDQTIVVCLTVIGLTLAYASCALAADEERPTYVAQAARRPRRSVIAAGAAVLPGVIVHGSGHFVAGDPQTGYRLLAIEGAGLGAVALGFVPIVATGASRRLVGAGVVLTAGGVGLFAISALADLYGVLAPSGGLGAARGIAPILQTSFGYRYVYDPAFTYRHFVHYGLDYRLDGWRVQPSAWFATDDTNSRVRGLAAYRFVGPRPNGALEARDGSFLELQAALTRHAFTSNRFVTTTGEVAVAGRLDMGRVAPSLTGSFAEMGFGWALQAHAYGTARTSADVAELLLARFGYGMYIGWPGRPRGEVIVYYDHRHDGFAAGLKIPGLGSGVVGHFGMQGHFYMSNQWGVAAEVAAGSAYISGLSILFRYGEPL